MPPRPITLTLGLLATFGVAGCARNNKPANLPLPPRNRMAFDAETTMQMAVASRLEKERQSLDTMFLLANRAGPATRPATVEVPAPQLIPAPVAAGGAFNQGPSAHPVQEALAVVADANAHATRSPTPEGFLNAIQYYDYAPGVRYNTVAAAGYITTIRLRPGERLQSLFCSDTASYDIDQALEGVGPTAATVVLFKPKHAGGQSNWVLTTDERTYFLDVFVNAEPNYQSEIAWHYPLDVLRVLGERRDQGRLAGREERCRRHERCSPRRTRASTQCRRPPVPLPIPPNVSATDADGPTVGPLGMNLDGSQLRLRPALPESRA